MTLERGTSPTGLGEVLVTVTGEPAVARGATTVNLTCRTARGRPVTVGPPRVAPGKGRPRARTPHPPACVGPRAGPDRALRARHPPAMTATLPLR